MNYYRYILGTLDRPTDYYGDGPTRRVSHVSREGRVWCWKCYAKSVEKLDGVDAKELDDRRDPIPADKCPRCGSFSRDLWIGKKSIY